MTTTFTGDFEFGTDLAKSNLDDAFYLKITSQVWNFQQQKWELDALEAPERIIGTVSAPASGQLADDLTFTISANGGTAKTITVSKATAQLNSKFG